MANIYQLDVLCKCKKSYWTKDGRCNKCGADRSKEILADVDDVTFVNKRTANSKQHYKHKGET